MTPSFRRFLIALGVLAGLLAAARFAAAPLLLAYLSWTPPCSQPCADLGEKPYLLYDETSKSTDTYYRPACQPLAVDLELARTRLKAGKRYEIWHKTTLKNQSCFSLGSIEIDGDFTWPDAFSGEQQNLFMDVMDSDGREVNPTWPDPGFKEAIPYEVDMAAYKRLESTRRLEYSRSIDLGNGYVHKDYFYNPTLDLEPGDSLTGIPHIFAPYEKMDDNIDADLSNPLIRKLFEEAARGRKSAPVPADAGPHPPGGYRVSKGAYKPGRYRVQAVYRDTISAGRIYPRYDRLPERTKNVLHWITAHVVDVTPGESKRLKIETASRPIEIEVVP